MALPVPKASIKIPPAVPPVDWALKWAREDFIHFLRRRLRAKMTSAKQNSFRALCQKHKYVLAAGCRNSTKTVACLHALIDHVCKVKNSNIGIISISQSIGQDSGIWQDLIESIIPLRIAAGHIKWVKQPWIKGVSKKPTCIVGTLLHPDWPPVQIQLESLMDEKVVEKRFKNRRWTCVYVPELQNFKSFTTFITWTECLRSLKGVPDNQMLFMGDINPPVEGPEHWAYKVWFELSNKPESEVPKELLGLWHDLARMDFSLEDNIFDTPARIASLKAKYSHDQDEYDRNVRGLWVRQTVGALFYEVFRPDFHVRGDIETDANPNPEILVPHPSSIELFTSNDLGQVNSATVIFDRWYRTELVERDGETFSRTVSVFTYLDELFWVKKDFHLEDYVDHLLERMDFWEQQASGEIAWTHYSDRNIFTVRDLSGRQYLNELVYDLSDGRINMIGAADVQGHYSRQMRVDFFRKLLFDARVFFNANFCQNLITMCKVLRRGKNGSAYEQQSIYRHAFDAASYASATLCYEEIREAGLSLSRKRLGSGGAGIVQVAL